MPAGTRSWRGICLWLLPNNQNVPLCQAGKGVEFLRQGAEAAGDADDLPAVATFVFQLAGIVTILAAGREPSGYALRVSPPDGSRRTATTCAAVWHVSMNRRSDVVTPRSSPAFSSSWMRAPAGSNCFTSLALSFAECVFPESTSLSSSLCLRFAAAYGHTGRGCRPSFRGRGTRNTPLRRLV
jgi:hypothetical protein